MTPRMIGVVTVGRSDYGMVTPILKAIQREPSLRLHLIVSGAHLSAEFGATINDIERDGVPIGDRVEMLRHADTPEGIADSIGRGVSGFARSFAATRPDVLLILGDRVEMCAAALAALPMTIPVAHLHGGELTEGAIDDALRHAMTKLSHVHFVATDAYAKRVMQLGEEPWRVTRCGAPSLDHITDIPRLNREELHVQFGLRLREPILLVTCHPVTLEFERTEWHIAQLLEALAEWTGTVVFTAPNADTHGRLIRRAIEAFLSAHPQHQMIEHLGRQGYVSVMAQACAMVGNSSSGLIEAPSFELPVVNIGSRQQGRIRAANVIDVGETRQDILDGIRQATAPAFRQRLRGLVNPYDQGGAAAMIVRRLKEMPIDARLLRKRFVDLPAASASHPEPTVVSHAD
ncbi:MAG: UDP-N-acetylglucosamine 2-epimerase (hydrolyzing) [Candidatus Omnitrophica bacterium]|nr:UDP-N-acetylglucosamine 2-epimerase (hydrolyzing) [Candidatus Omnitrophota bacterium]